MSNDHKVIEFIPAPTPEKVLHDMAESDGLVLHGKSRKDVARAFHDAFDLIGGVPRLAIWGDENPTDFYKLWARLLPSAAADEIQEADVIRIQHVLPRTKLDE